MTTAAKLAVVLLYKRDTQPDERLVRLIQSELASRGCSVFIDRHLNMGVEWAREIETRIRSADAIIPLLSADAIQSEMLAFEIETAHETAQLEQGRPAALARPGELHRSFARAVGQHPRADSVFSLGRRVGRPGPGD